jgi:predicted ferric reductase
MENKKGINFFFIIIAIVTASKLIKHFDFQNFKFNHLAIDIIYLIAFLASVFFLIKDLVKRK